WLMNDKDEALADLNMAIKLSPTDARAYVVRSFLRYEAKEDHEGLMDDATARWLDNSWSRRFTATELERGLLGKERRAAIRRGIERANEVRLGITPSPVESVLAAMQAETIGKKIMATDDLTLTAQELKFVRANPDMFYAPVWQDRFARAGERAGVNLVLRNLN